MFQFLIDFINSFSNNDKFINKPFVKVKNTGVFSRSMYVSLKKMRENIKNEKINVFKDQILKLDYEKTIYYSDFGISNTPGLGKNEMIIFGISGPRELLEKLKDFGEKSNQKISVPVFKRENLI